MWQRPKSLPPSLTSWKPEAQRGLLLSPTDLLLTPAVVQEVLPAETEVESSWDKAQRDPMDREKPDSAGNITPTCQELNLSWKNQSEEEEKHVEGKRVQKLTSFHSLLSLALEEAGLPPEEEPPGEA